MSKKPTVSVGIPTYNRPELLKKALDSVVSQTYKNLEILISDNCSTSPEVETLCREYAEKDSRIKYFRQEKNIGVGANGQFLIDTMAGDYYFIVNDDDWVNEHFVEECLKIFEENPDCYASYGTVHLYGEDGVLAKACETVKYTQDAHTDRMCGYLQNGIEAFLAAVFMRSDDLKKLKDHQDRFCEDQIFLMKIIFDGKFICSEKSIYNKLNNGCTKDLETLKKTFGMPDSVNSENFWEILAQTHMESILYDDFYNGKLDKQERIRLSIEIYNTLKEKNNPSPKKRTFIERVRSKLRK